ncbi:polyribonucleotide nucleotidyltransferase [Bacillus sp. Marseille-Q3570]|uniref:polyribonucleotide nucleotidyltransferase n=1 Tax=Bacillus sp. Marseille-Q3570 TaxID=2963522 RepID=UPI0021B72717|nr:polyribonucleotide nucleotidyltransferase [Bacillus sp. Marseille-Q3570]
MELSSFMANDLQQLRHTLNMNLLDGNLATQAAQSTVMLKDFEEAQQAVQAQHPTSGHTIDLKG